MQSFMGWMSGRCVCGRHWASAAGSRVEPVRAGQALDLRFHVGAVLRWIWSRGASRLEMSRGGVVPYVAQLGFQAITLAVEPLLRNDEWVCDRCRDGC